MYILLSLLTQEFFRVNSSALKKYKHSPAHFVRSQPEIIHLTPGATRTLVFISFHGKKGQISSSTVLNFIFGLKDTQYTHLSSEIRGICLMKLTLKKFQKFPFFLEYKNPTRFFRFSFQANLDFFFNCRCLLGLGMSKKNVKTYLGFLIPKIWQILKSFPRIFHQA